MNESTRVTRRGIRLPPENYVGDRLYFLTICCRRRKPIFRNAEIVASHLERLGELSPKMGFVIHAYCFMPDHLHLLVGSLTAHSRLVDFVARFKQLTGYEYSRKYRTSLWQPKYYDHILRRESAMHDVAWYIWMNPIRKGLVSRPRDYPFSGSFSMDWPTSPPGASWHPPWKQV